MRAEAMEDLHDAHKIEPNGIGMEAVYVGINKLGSIRAAMALGQIESICDYEWPDAEQKVLTATQWRKVCGIPQGGKVPVMEWAEAYTGETIDSQDDADALAIAYATAMWFTTEHE
jgi:Holliday junction resolvasome RuvABC endonuclease subunit